MNQRILPACVFLCLFAASCMSVLAQDAEIAEASASDDSFTPEFRVGISGGLTKNFHQDFMMDFPVEPLNLTTDSTIRFSGYSVGLVVGYRASKRFGLDAHLRYSTHPGSGIHLLPSAWILLPSSASNDDPIFVKQIVQARREVEYSLWELDLMGIVDVLSTDGIGVGLAAGMSFAHVGTFTETATQELVSPRNSRFINQEGWPERDSGRVLVFAEDEPVEDASSMRLSLRGGAFIDLSFGSPVHFTPGVYYDYGLTSVMKDSDWMLNALLLQLDVTMEL